MSAVGLLRRKLQLLQPRTGVRSRPLSSALALCRIPPANNAISSTALKLCVHSLNKIIPSLYHKRGDKNNYGMWKRWHITVFVIAPAARGAPWSIDEMYGPPPDCKRVEVNEGTLRVNVSGL